MMAKVRYCTWDPRFVKRDERECPFFTLENWMHKLDHTSWMTYITVSFGLPQLLRTLPCSEDKGVY